MKSSTAAIHGRSTTPTPHPSPRSLRFVARHPTPINLYVAGGDPTQQTAAAGASTAPPTSSPSPQTFAWTPLIYGPFLSVLLRQNIISSRGTRPCWTCSSSCTTTKQCTRLLKPRHNNQAFLFQNLPLDPPACSALPGFSA
jgi:hypothetical protein